MTLVFLITAGERKEARKGRQKVGVERREGKRREGKRKVSFLHFYIFPVLSDRDHQPCSALEGNAAPKPECALCSVHQIACLGFHI